MLAEITLAMEMPTNGHAYCDIKLPIPSTSPPAIANPTDGPLSCKAPTSMSRTKLNGNRQRRRRRRRRMVFLQTKYLYSLISSTSGLYHHSTTSLEILSRTPKVIYLVQLGQEIGRLRSAASNLSQRECKDDCNKVICEGVVQIGVHKIAPLSLHQIEQSWPCAQKAQSCYHKCYGTPFLLYKIHLCKYKNPSFSQQLLVNFFFFFFLSLFLQEKLIRRKIHSNSFSLQYQLVYV
jgi:hypothetical protein